ncbi:hypothetical protein SAMN04487783_0476 [Agrococcus baldri]|uniref:Uncharacterized protein n=1 Tax=Agrococcus baldri TaxID=153730 RepID=A0AA94HKI4_9MICO|nr:hypothetical protein [Agrococcus baldri]SFS00691.1 hypothetical protein SAMN04487783_0476 [Agrococcus baldri]
MEPIDAVEAIGELVSWFCLVPGIPLLLAGWLLRVRDGAWEPVEIVVIPQGDRTLARWYAGDGFHERRLSRAERMRLGTHGEHVAQVSARHPGRMRLRDHPPLQRMLTVLGTVLTAAGLLGLALSLLPLFA